MKKLIILGLGLLLTLNPIKVNANQEYEEWQLELLETANLEIKPLSNFPPTFKNEILKIDNEYYLVEVIGTFKPDWEMVNGWSQSSYGYYRTKNIEVNIPQLADEGILRNDISSNIIEVSTAYNIYLSSNLNLFTVNQGPYNLSIRVDDISSINELKTYLNDINFTIYYKLEEPRYTLLDWYNPSPEPEPPTPDINYYHLIIPSLLIIAAGYIVLRRKEVIE